MFTVILSWDFKLWGKESNFPLSFWVPDLDTPVIRGQISRRKTNGSLATCIPPTYMRHPGKLSNSPKRHKPLP